MDEFNDEPINYGDIQAHDELYNVRGGYNLPRNEKADHYTPGQINAIEAELAEKQGLEYKPYFKRARTWDLKEKKQKAKTPYEQTIIPPEQSIKSIYKLLNEYGAKDILFSDKGYVLFRISNGNKILTIRKIKPNIKDDKVAWRYVYWNLKSSLEALASKMATIEEEFLQDTLIQLSDGSFSTVGREARKRYLPQLPSG